MAAVAKIAVLIALLIAFATVGIGCLVNPDWGIKHFGSISLRTGGELRREWNRVGFQIVGAVMTAFVIYIVFHIIRD